MIMIKEYTKYIKIKADYKVFIHIYLKKEESESLYYKYKNLNRDSIREIFKEMVIRMFTRIGNNVLIKCFMCNCVLWN